jgi:solute:Na+ symporter, SSS family
MISRWSQVGIPNEAFKLGFFSLRWVGTINFFVYGYMGASLRLRKVSHLRNHQSPVDFITDRYQSQLLRYSIVTLQILPAVIYLAAQVIAIKTTFNSIFNLSPDAAYPVTLIMLAILIFEWLGGLSSVALTDTVQAVVMVGSFVILPSIIFKNFGGWSDMDPETYPKPQFYQTMSKEAQFSFWQFTLVNFGLFTLPHFIQRVYSAKDLVSMKTALTVVTISPWFTLMVGVFLGTVAVNFLVNEDGTPQTPANPFAAILEALMDLGGFAKVAAVIAFTASLAAIMSTADSILIAISQLVTTEMIYPLQPSATPNVLTWYGRGVSAVCTAFSLVIG